MPNRKVLSLRWIVVAAALLWAATPSIAVAAGAEPVAAQPRDVELGDPMVRRIQAALQTLGDYRGAVDGAMGPATETAIRAYQVRSGLDPDGRATEPLVTRIEFALKTAELQARLEVVRARQIRVAEAALFAQEETRHLLSRRPEDQRADAGRDISACLDAPNISCLLTEASESAKAIFDVRRRDWVLSEILAAHARAGLVNEAFAAAGRISDARLIVNSLRDIVIIRAGEGDLEWAADASLLVPDAAARGKAVAAVAAGYARRGDDAAMAVSVKDVITISAGLSNAAAAELLTGLGTALGPIRPEQARDVLALARARAEATTGFTRDGALAAVASGYCAADDLDAALAILDGLHDPVALRTVRVALVSAAIERGDFAGALGYAAAIDEARYRAVNFARIATAGVDAGDPSVATARARAVENAHATDPAEGYARANALRAAAGAQARSGEPDLALETTRAIGDARIRAEAAWFVAASGYAAGSDATVESGRTLFLASAEAIGSDVDRVWALCSAAILSHSVGDSGSVRQILTLALREAADTREVWARARAFAKVASTLIQLSA